MDAQLIARRKGVFWRIHLWAAFIATPFALIGALTGMLYIFTPQIESVQHGHLDRVAPAATRVPLDDLVAAAQRAAPPGASLRYVVTPEHADQSVRAYFGAPGAPGATGAAAVKAKASEGEHAHHAEAATPMADRASKGMARNSTAAVAQAATGRLRQAPGSSGGSPRAPWRPRLRYITQPETSHHSTPMPNTSSRAWFHHPNSPRWKGMPTAVALLKAVKDSQPR